MIFASLRFDDAIHVRPDELIMNDEGLFGVAWQTKVDRKRAGTKFVVPAVGFKDQEWLDHGWQILNSSPLDRDFWIPELNTRTSFLTRPPTYQRTVQWMRFFAFAAWQDDHPEDKIETMKVQTTLSNLTAHSCRVTPAGCSCACRSIDGRDRLAS